MRTLLTTIAALLLGALTSCTAQQPTADGIKHARTLTLRVDGDCPMCEKTIEKVAFVKGEAHADWDVDAKTALITWDSTRTTEDAVLRRIAEAGYDNERYLAPDAAYAALPGCCQYERSMKRTPAATTETHDHAGHDHATAQTAAAPATDPLSAVFTAYFHLKDALVSADAALAMKTASELDGALHNVDPSTLSAEVKPVFTEVAAELMPALHPLTTTKELDKQRELFARLTAPMAKLAKAAPQHAPIYLDHCPMYNGGADWLSTEKAIRNPFYGAQMMSCGSVKETIAK